MGMVVMQERSKSVMKEIFEQPLESQNIMAVQDLTEDMVTFILTHQQLSLDRLLIKQTDFQVYVHSVNVAILSLVLGRVLKLNDETLFLLGIGALMHDIGKRSLPKEILRKQGKLDKAEFDIYKQHVPDGVRLSESIWKVPAPSIIAVSQHHELLNGQGYPNGCRNPQSRTYPYGLQGQRFCTPRLLPWSAVDYMTTDGILCNQGRIDGRYPQPRRRETPA